jgi:hypothetical protein
VIGKIIPRDKSGELWQVMTVMVKTSSYVTKHTIGLHVFIGDKVCGVLPNIQTVDTWYTIKCNNGNGIKGSYLKLER